MNDCNYWKKLWETNDTKWHGGGVHPLLIKFLPQLKLKKNEYIFVPLCGASIDMLYLATQGYNVVGNEISSIACEKFFYENNLQYKIEKHLLFTLYKTEHILIYCGNYFDLTYSLLPDIKAVYDRAALIALPKNIRESYVKQLSSLIPNKLNLLLITIGYQNARNMPPYLIDEQEIDCLYNDYYEVVLIGQFDDTPICTDLLERNFVNPLEKVYHIRERF